MHRLLNGSGSGQSKKTGKDRIVSDFCLKALKLLCISIRIQTPTDSLKFVFKSAPESNKSHYLFAFFIVPLGFYLLIVIVYIK